ncbi:hypothetical protein Tco_1095614 [Tanacetum coccineum]
MSTSGSSGFQTLLIHPLSVTAIHGDGFFLSTSDVELEALNGPDGDILGDKGAGLSQRESYVSVNRFQKQ